MFPYDYVLAAALLCQSLDSVEPLDATEAFPSLRQALQELAQEWEILDPREARVILSRAEDFAADLHLLRSRRLELADVPPAHDSQRFPDRAAVAEHLTFNRAYRQKLATRQLTESGRWWELQAAIQESDRLYEVWDLVRDARCDYYYVTVRRAALKRLRAAIGEEAYYSGQMPPHVPVWRFQPIR